MILQELAEAIGPSGNEREVRILIRRALEGCVERTWVDALGNLHAEKPGDPGGDPGGDHRGSPLRVLLTAHMDEVSLVVAGYTEAGGLRVRAAGSIDDRVLPGALLWIGPQRIPGVIGLKPVHLLEKGEEDKVVPLRSLVIDVGAKGKEEAARLAPLGTAAVFATRFRQLGPTVLGKAFDDRAGCAALVEIVRTASLPHDLHIVFTAQEEAGMRGARVAGYAARPDCAIVLEGTIADDLPKEKEGSPTSELGKGPAITVMDRSFIAHRGLVKLLVETAEAEGIPHQFKQPGIGGTDSGAIHIAREGVPSVTVAIPCRYIHSPVSVLNLADFENTVRLVREAVGRLTGDTVTR